MKTIKKDELFTNLSDFLSTKGVELKDGAYAHRINQACDLLTDAINGTQKTVKHARVEVDKKLEQLRQSIHEATAPKPAPGAPSPKTQTASRTAKPAEGSKPKPSATSKKALKRK